MPPQPEHFGPFELLEKIGEGGMAEAFVAVRRQGAGAGERQVCLKRILPGLEGDQEFVRLFLREARIAATLDHPNIVRVLDCGVIGRLHYLELELVDGMDLRELLKVLTEQQRALSWELTAMIAIDLATALQAAHGSRDGDAAAPIVHRDISPSNVLLGKRGQVKLTDFGIAKSLRDTQHTKTGIIKGKVSYMAPEYARSGRLDERCDRFSLGVLLFECLTGIRPYDGATELDTLERATRGDHRPLVDLAADVPAEFVEIVERLISPDAQERFPDTRALTDALVELSPPAATREHLAQLVAKHAPQARKHRRGLRSSPNSPQGSASGMRVEMNVRPPADRTLLHVGLVAVVAAVAIASTWLLSRETAPTSEAASQPPLPGADSAEPPPERSGPAAASTRAEVVPSSSPPTPATESALPPLETPPSKDTQAASERQPSGPAPKQPAPHQKASGKATLTVVVIPFGNVWVDGRPLGEAPVTIQAAPGVHRIGAGTDSPQNFQTVTLTAGETRRVVLE